MYIGDPANVVPREIYSYNNNYVGGASVINSEIVYCPMRKDIIIRPPMLHALQTDKGPHNNN